MYDKRQQIYTDMGECEKKETILVTKIDRGQNIHIIIVVSCLLSCMTQKKSFLRKEWKQNDKVSVYVVTGNFSTAWRTEGEKAQMWLKKQEVNSETLGVNKENIDGGDRLWRTLRVKAGSTDLPQQMWEKMQRKDKSDPWKDWRNELGKWSQQCFT